MKAIVLDGIDKPLAYRDAPEPLPSTGEALVRIKAAAFNHRDVWIQKGQYAGLKFPIIPGSDGAGVVESVAESGGESVEKSWIGKEVIINPSLGWGDSEKAQVKTYRILGLPDDGTFAEFIKIPTGNLAPKPAHLSFEQAAALPLAGLTAYRSLFVRAAMSAGGEKSAGEKVEKVLITGIGGGVALFALQFAVAAGATVFVTSGSDEKIDAAKKLGASGGANYKTPNWAESLQKETGGFDVIVDSAGGDGFASLVGLASAGGRLVFYGATLGAVKDMALSKVFWKQLSLLGSTMGSPKDFADMLRFVSEKNIVPVVDNIFPLAGAEQGARRMDAAQQFGKIVLVP